MEARLEDALLRCEKGTTATLGFLSAAERAEVERLLRMRGVSRWDAWGGYADAERVLVLLPPPYLEEFFPTWGATEGDEPTEYLAEARSEAVASVRIVGSGYRKLSHRDYLGSLLGLGLERDVLGDIALQNDREAVVFCAPHIVGFLCEELKKVASDTVRCLPYVPDAAFTDGRSYLPIRTTVASLRLDCVVAALTNHSREATQRAILTGTVEVNHEVCERADRFLTPPTTLSVRGEGRFYLRSVEGDTRKGRIRIFAEKLV